jgi:hypothetical protein
VATWNIFSKVSSKGPSSKQSEVVAHGLHYQALASQDGSKVVPDEIAIRIFFKSLQPESVQTWTRVRLGETLTIRLVMKKLWILLKLFMDGYVIAIMLRE